MRRAPLIAALTGVALLLIAVGMPAALALVSGGPRRYYAYEPPTGVLLELTASTLASAVGVALALFCLGLSLGLLLGARRRPEQAEVRDDLPENPA
ncbi:hypothetical protein [Naasia aerilata]|uniref:Uncharacterized protein n=1 Tax=Naasia aerilata TaxID=1162966 RepID=A0ABN6XNR4_9MICO|nr:hypothetical protein [Naasia aerilata]BDZ46627.1 hypothetical protein GCM10025866_25360 [Naasia aerilata]